MRTISILGVVLGFFVIGMSTWRWMFVFDSPFRLVVGLFIAISIMAWAYIIEWMTGKHQSDENLSKRIDSLAQEIRGKYEQLDIKIQSKNK